MTPKKANAAMLTTRPEGGLVPACSLALWYKRVLIVVGPVGIGTGTSTGILITLITTGGVCVSADCTFARKGAAVLCGCCASTMAAMLPARAAAPAILPTAMLACSETGMPVGFGWLLWLPCGVGATTGVATGCTTRPQGFIGALGTTGDTCPAVVIAFGAVVVVAFGGGAAVVALGAAVVALGAAVVALGFVVVTCGTSVVV